MTRDVFRQGLELANSSSQYFHMCSNSTAAQSAVALAKADPESSTNASAIAELLLEIVAEKTGYPADMLELEMGLDADLGIDSIKRVEILSAVQERQPDLPVVKPEHLGQEHLGQLQTLQDIVDFLAPNQSSAQAAATMAICQSNPEMLENIGFSLWC